MEKLKDLKSNDFKKMRKYARQESDRIYKKFAENFDINKYLKPCPKFIPKFIWNFLIWIIIKHK